MGRAGARRRRDLRAREPSRRRCAGSRLRSNRTTLGADRRPTSHGLACRFPCRDAPGFSHRGSLEHLDQTTPSGSSALGGRAPIVRTPAKRAAGVWTCRCSRCCGRALAWHSFAPKVSPSKGKFLLCRRDSEFELYGSPMGVGRRLETDITPQDAEPSHTG